MATRNKSIAFAIQRFKGFWSQYKQSKRGVLGIAIILVFAVVAIFAPLISPLDPMSPKWEGYYPGGTQPKLADKLCVPIWYKSLLGMNDLSENMKVVQDHQFTTEESFSTQWNWVLLTPGYNVDVQYSPTGGHQSDGCIAISYVREETEAAPPNGEIVIRLEKEFYFPYNGNPYSFYWHYSFSIENRTALTGFPIDVAFSIRRGDEPQSYLIRSTALPFHQVLNRWYSRADTTQAEQSLLEETIFTQAGNYTFEVTLTLAESGNGRQDFTVRADNLQLLLYGRAFGLLGTTSIPDASPRDLFTMLVYGTRISFLIGLLTAVFSVIIGLSVGLVAGYVRGLVDEALMRFADFLMVIPSLPLLIVLVTVLGKSIWNIIGVLIFMGWMGFSRSVRSMVLSLRERPFIESAKAAGAGTFYVIYKHILPNVFALVYISLATAVPGAVISEASLAWLGLGDITVPSWGIMLYDFGRTQTAIIKGVGEYWFWVIPPGVAIALMAMAFILMGFSLDEVLNPRLRKRR